MLYDTSHDDILSPGDDTKMHKRLTHYFAVLLFALGTLVLPQGASATGSTLNYGSLNIGCTNAPQTGNGTPATSDNFAGCTITVYRHNTSTLTGAYYNATGSVMTNPIVLKTASGTVTTSGTTVTWVSGSDFNTAAGAWIGQTININGAGYTITAVGGAETTITTAQTLPTLSTAVSYTVRPQISTVYLRDGQYDVCVSNALSTPVLQGTCNLGLDVNFGPLLTNAQKAQLTAAFTDASTTGLQAITGLSFAFNSTFTTPVSFHCALGYSEATAAAGVGFGVGVLTTAPTRLDAVHTTVYSAAGAQVAGPITNLTTTTPTAFSTVTPDSTVVYPAYIDGTVQLAGGGAATLQFYVQQGTAGDLVVVAAGSYCTIN